MVHGMPFLSPPVTHMGTRGSWTQVCWVQVCHLNYWSTTALWYLNLCWWWQLCVKIHTTGHGCQWQRSRFHKKLKTWYFHSCLMPASFRVFLMTSMNCSRLLYVCIYFRCSLLIIFRFLCETTLFKFLWHTQCTIFLVMLLNLPINHYEAESKV